MDVVGEDGRSFGPGPVPPRIKGSWGGAVLS